MSEAERVWARIKTTARELAAKHRSPDLRYAEDIVSRIVADEHAERLPPGALKYLAKELRALSSQYTEDPSEQIRQ